MTHAGPALSDNVSLPATSGHALVARAAGGSGDRRRGVLSLVAVGRAILEPRWLFSYLTPWCSW